MFHHPSWAGGTYSSGTPAVGIKSTDGLYHLDGSPGILLNQPTCALEDFPGGADGDLAGVDELVGEVPDGQPHQAPARVGKGGGDAILRCKRSHIIGQQGAA